MTTQQIQMTLAGFIASQGLTMTAKPADQNPNTTDDKWHAEADHWACTLRVDGDNRRRWTVPFSMGSGHRGAEPTLASVLDCLASDASSIENTQGFEDWASDMGWNADSRKAERTYKICEAQAKRLRSFLGEEAYQQLLWNTERE